MILRKFFQSSFLTILFLLVFIVNSNEINAQKHSEVKPVFVELSKIHDLIAKISDNKLRGLKDGMVLDANKDGIKDIAVIVELTNPTVEGIRNIKNLYSNLKIQYLCEASNNCADEIDLSTPAFLIIHGKNKGWKINNISTFQSKNPILFRGRENILSFQKTRLERNEDTMGLFKDKNGIGFDFGTEASELYLQFKKGKYNWYETEP